MANHALPTTSSTYTNFVSELSARFNDLALGLDPAFVTATNVPTNAMRFSSAAAKWQRWNGTSWVDPVATYAIAISGNAGTVTNGVYTSGSYADPSWITSLAGTKITGNIAGNAGTATTLATARTINGVSFNGSANISVNTNSSITFNNAGSGAASGATFNGGSAITVSYNTVGAPSTTGANASGTWGISVTGNAATATSAGSVTNGVYTVGDQTIGGTKTFSSQIIGRTSGNTDGLYAYYAPSTGGAFTTMWSRRGPYTSFVNHTGSSFSPTMSVVYEYTGGYSGVYSIGHLATSGANPGNLAIHHLNSSGAASNTWLFDGATGNLSTSGRIIPAGGIQWPNGTVQTTYGFATGAGKLISTARTFDIQTGGQGVSLISLTVRCTALYGNWGSGTITISIGGTVVADAGFNIMEFDSRVSSAYPTIHYRYTGAANTTVTVTISHTGPGEFSEAYWSYVGH